MNGPIDSPIRKPEDDVLGRAPRAEALAAQLAALDASEGLVIAILGTWGSGKTSFVNLLRPHLAASASVVMDFNPWTFSGTDQLAGAFFVELSAKLKADSALRKVGKRIAGYADALSYLDWVPGVDRVAKASQALGRWRDRRQGGVAGERARVESALDSLDHPVVVILDDIDRLSGPEVREIFKLIRLVARLPNIVYVTAFDRDRVAGALDEEGMPGHLYLDKILQLSVELPQVPQDLLTTETFSAMDTLLNDDATAAPFDERTWPDVYEEIIKPLVRTIRDLRRYAASLRITLHELGGEIAFTDAAALEAIRLFLPDSYSRIPELADALTTTASTYVGPYVTPDPHEAQILAFAEEATSPDVIRALINRLFPAAGRHIGGMSYMADFQNGWLRERRVAHIANLRFFTERAPTAQLRHFRLAEEARRLLSDESRFDGYLRSIDPSEQQDVITALEVFQDLFDESEVVSGVTVLLNLLPDLPERPFGFFHVGPRLAVTRVVLRLLRVLDTPEKVEAVAREVLPRVSTLAAKLELVSDLGDREGIGHRLIADESARELEREWCYEVRSTEPQMLAQERDLLRLFLIARDWCAEVGAISIPDHPALVGAIIRDAQSESVAQDAGSRAVTRATRIAWDALVTVFGSENALVGAIEDAKEAGEISDALAALLARYASGWRPD